MAEGEQKNQRHSWRPQPAFWIKLALAANFLAQLFPGWLVLLLGLLALALPAWLFRP
jgi:hypothetical protein